MEVINKVLYLTGKIGTMQNAGKMGGKVQGFNSTVRYLGHPYFRCYTEANAQEAVTEIVKESIEKMACCMLDHALKATMCQKRLISFMRSVGNCIIR